MRELLDEDLAVLFEQWAVRLPRADAKSPEANLSFDSTAGRS